MAPLRLAVAGDPVSHSRSPELFLAMLANAGIDGTYEAIRVVAGDGARAFEELRANGYAGLNVTTPLKEEAYARAETLDEVATAAGSVNLLVLGDRIAGFNTDGAGALGALAGVGLGNVTEKRVLVLGAGPTARASIFALRSAGARVAIWNRTQSRADDVVRTLGVLALEPEARYDAVLSTLLPGVVPSDVGAQVTHAIHVARNVIDANYGARSTLAVNFNRPNLVDGFEMLHASARASFAIFTNAPISG